MGADPLSLAIMGGTAALGAASSYGEARANNRAIRRSQESARNQAIVADQQAADATAVEIERSRREFAGARARASVLAGGRGVSGDTSADLDRAFTLAGGLDQAIMEHNLDMQRLRIRSEFDATAGALGSRVRSPGAAALTGGLGGLGTGMSLGSSAQTLFPNLFIGSGSGRSEG